MTMDPESVADLARALAVLTEKERADLTYQLSGVARQFAEEGSHRLVDVFQALVVLLAEEGDRQKHDFEEREREVDPVPDPDPDMPGGLAADEDDPETAYRKAAGRTQEEEDG